MDIHKRTVLDEIRDETITARIERIVCREFSFDPLKLKNNSSRKRENVIVRRLCMYFIKQFTSLTLASIGKRYRKNHDTVLYAIRKIDDERDVDHKFEILCSQLNSKIVQIREVHNSKAFGGEVSIAVEAINATLQSFIQMSRKKAISEKETMRRFREVLLNSSLAITCKIDSVYEHK